MRKWISSNICYSMCINIKCYNFGAAERDIQNVNDFKIKIGIKL